VASILYLNFFALFHAGFPGFQAVVGSYIDKKCPFTGNVSIRGRILSGVVLKMKMQRTIVIRRQYLHYCKKYNRFEKRHKNMSVHLSPAFKYVGKFVFIYLYMCVCVLLL
jgi:ribosomal protein S17